MNYTYITVLLYTHTQFNHLFSLYLHNHSKTVHALVQPTCSIIFNSATYTLTIYCLFFNHLTPNDPYMSRTAPLTSKPCILYIYSTNIGTEYFKHALYSPFFSLQNAVCFIMLTSLGPVLFTFYIQGVVKLKKRIIPVPKG